MAEQVGRFSCLAEGQGGTFRFDPRISPPHIGTAELKTSVGVYFPLPNNRCFVAHIYVTPKGGPNPDTGLTRALSAAENQAVRTLISGRLTQHASANEWTPQDVVDSIQGGKRAYVMCPVYSRPVESPGLPGTAVIKGIEDFLGTGGRLVRYINNDCVQGFAVEIQTGLIKTIEQKWEDKGGERVRVDDPPKGFSSVRALGAR